MQYDEMAESRAITLDRLKGIEELQRSIHYKQACSGFDGSRSRGVRHVRRALPKACPNRGDLHGAQCPNAGMDELDGKRDYPVGCGSCDFKKAFVSPTLQVVIDVDESEPGFLRQMKIGCRHWDLRDQVHESA